MKIRDILDLLEDDNGFGKVAAVNGDKVTVDKPDGSKMDVDNKAIIPDPSKPGNATIDASATGNDLKAGMNINTTAQEGVDDEEEVVEEIQAEEEPDLIGSGKNKDIGGDPTDDFIDDVRDKDFEKRALATGGRESKKFNEELERWKRIAGL